MGKYPVQNLGKSIKNWASNCSSKIRSQNSAKYGVAKSRAKENNWALTSTYTKCNALSLPNVPTVMKIGTKLCIIIFLSAPTIDMNAHSSTENSIGTHELSYLLSNATATLPLLKYIQSTKCLKQTFGTVLVNGQLVMILIAPEHYFFYFTPL